MGEAAIQEKKIKDMTLSELKAQLGPAITVMVRRAITEELAKAGGLSGLVDSQIQDRLAMLIDEGFLAAGPMKQSMESATNATEGGLILPPGVRP